MIQLCAFADEASKKFTEQLDALKEQGISLIELRTLDGKNILDLTESEAASYADLLDQNGIGVWSLGSPLGKADIRSDADSYFRSLRQALRLASIFGCRNIRIFSFFHAYNQRDAVIDRLKRSVELADKAGIRLCHENEKRIYGDTAERVADLLDHVEGLHCVFDPANFLQVGEKMDTAYELLHSRTLYFHIKDVIAESGELVPAGYGDCKISGLISKITDDKVLTLEPHLAIFDGYASTDSSELKTKFRFSSTREAFSAAAESLRKLLLEADYRRTDERGVEQWKQD